MSIINRIVDWISTPYTVYLVLKEATISRSVKIRAITGLVLIFIYIISPIDLIPDFIPFSGWLDDLIVVPIGFVLLRKLTPGFNLVEKRNRAQASVGRIVIWTIVSLAAFILLFLASLGLLVYLIVRLITG